MHPNEILPAITRQKVKHIKSGEIFYVIGLHPTERQWVMLLTMDGFKDEAPLGNLEPVHDEPRPLRIGDKVATHSCTLSTIAAICRLTDNMVTYRVQHSDYDFYENQLRHATHEELAKYF